MSQSEWMEPIANLFTAIDNYMVYVMHQMDLAMQANTTAPPRQFISAVERHKRFARDFMPFMHSASRHMSMLVHPAGLDAAGLDASALNASASTSWSAQQSVVEEVVDAQEVLGNHAHQGGGRRRWGRRGGDRRGGGGRRGRSLLSIGGVTIDNGTATTTTTWKERLQDMPPYSEDAGLGSVQAYSTLVAGAGVTNPALNTYEDWLDGPFQWPPLERVSIESCPSGVAMANVLVGAFNVLRDHVTNPLPPPTHHHQRVNATLPPIHTYTGPMETGSVENDKRDTVVSTSLHAIRSFITDVIGIEMRKVVGFFSGPKDPEDGGLTATAIVHRLTSCDFKNVIDCQKKRAAPWVGGLAVILILLLIYMSMGSIASFVIGGVSVPLLIMWYVYGYTPMCIPMVPECAVRDILDTMSWLVPLQLQWPTMLQKVPGCALNPDVPHDECFVSCMDPPFRYRGWEATIAWAACDWDPHWCATTVAPWARSNGFNVLWAELSDKFNAIENEYTGVANGNGRVDAERFCFSITIINVVPYIFLALAAFYALTSVALMPLVVLQWMVDVLMQSLAYIHMHAPGRRGGD